jgi:hypothetical protein
MAAEQSMICGMIWTKAMRAPAALQVDSLPSNLRKTIGFKEHVSAPWPRHLQTELTRWRLQHQKTYSNSVKCSSFLLPSFLPGKARILVSHATPRKTLNLGFYLAFQLHYAVLHTRRVAKRLLVEEEFYTKPMQFQTIIFKFKYRASSSSSYSDKFLIEICYTLLEEIVDTINEGIQQQGSSLQSD